MGSCGTINKHIFCCMTFFSAPLLFVMGREASRSWNLFQASPWKRHEGSKLRRQAPPTHQGKSRWRHSQLATRQLAAMFTET